MNDNFTHCDQITQELLADAKEDKQTLYAIIDSAVHTNIHRLIKSKVDKGDYSNLFHETDFAEIEDAAPYLVRLTANNTDFLNKLWAHPWGIFLTTSVEHEEIEEHLRRNLMAEDPLGEELIFRYYDPRVLPMFLDSSNEEERHRFFGPIDEIHVFLEQEGYLEKYTAQEEPESVN